MIYIYICAYSFGYAFSLHSRQYVCMLNIVNLLRDRLKTRAVVTNPSLSIDHKNILALKYNMSICLYIKNMLFSGHLFVIKYMYECKNKKF